MVGWDSGRLAMILAVLESRCGLSLGANDVYLNIAGTVSPDQNFIVLRAVKSPLVAWIWAGAVVLVLGTLYSLLPPARPTKTPTTREDVATV